MLFSYKKHISQLKIKLTGRRGEMGKFFSVIRAVIVEDFSPISCVAEEIVKGRLLKIQATCPDKCPLSVYMLRI